MIRKTKKKTPVSKHMLELSNCYNPRTKTLRTEKGENLRKYAHGYFDLYKYNKSKLTTAVQNFLKSYRQWYLSQYQANQDDFKFIFQIMVQAHPKTLTLCESKDSNTNIYRIVEHIRFPYLKQIEISFETTFNIQSIAWLQAPVLQEMTINSRGQLSSVNSLAKSNLKNLKKLKVKNHYSLTNESPANYDLGKVSRIEMFQISRSKEKLNFQRCEISMFRQDLTNLAILSKSQLQKLPNFKVAQRVQKKGDNNPISIKKICQSLNRKFMNQTIYEKMKLNTLYHFLGNMYEDYSQVSSGNNHSYYRADSDDEDRLVFGSGYYDDDGYGYDNYYD